MSLHLGLDVTEILRVLRELREGWHVLQFPDRAVLIGQILPALSKPGMLVQHKSGNSGRHRAEHRRIE